MDTRTGKQFDNHTSRKVQMAKFANGGDGKIYTMNHNGMVFISSDTGEILNQAEMGGTYDDNTRSSIAISGSNLYIRTNENYIALNSKNIIVNNFISHPPHPGAIYANLPPGGFFIYFILFFMGKN